MKKLFLATILFAITIISYSQEQTTFILVRHAEKALDGTNDPPLSEAGHQRANNLAAILADQKIDALYSTPYKRTTATLTPIGRKLGVEVKTYDPFAKKDWLEKVLKNQNGGTVVISGHSNTIPELANLLLGREEFSQFDDNDYSNLIIVITDKIGSGKLVRLKY